MTKRILILNDSLARTFHTSGTKCPCENEVQPMPTWNFDNKAPEKPGLKLQSDPQPLQPEFFEAVAQDKKFEVIDEMQRWSVPQPEEQRAPGKLFDFNEPEK